MVQVQRSPAKASWLVMYNGIVLHSAPTKKAAEAVQLDLNHKYGHALAVL